MTRRCAPLLFAVLPLLGGCDRTPLTPVPGTGLNPPVATVRLGKTIPYSTPRPETDYQWAVLNGPGHGFVSQAGVYHAPFIAPESLRVEIEAAGAQVPLRATAYIDDRVPPDPSDCCGPSQPRLPAHGEYVHVDDLPYALVRAAPRYPDEAREAGIQGTVLVDALICADGQIIETVIAWSIPMLDDAAEEAVRTWRFSPARSAGEPVAVWVAVPVKFTLH